jgi:hypothetical protein
MPSTSHRSSTAARRPFEIVGAIFVAGEHERGGVVVALGRLVQEEGSVTELAATSL